MDSSSSSSWPKEPSSARARLVPTPTCCWSNSKQSFVVVPKQSETQYGVVRISGAYAVVSTNKSKMLEIQQFHYTHKISLKVKVIDETALVELPPLLNGNVKFNGNRQEIKRETNKKKKKKKKKQPTRGGAKAKEEGGIGAVEKKRGVLAYPRAEIESLRFENLEDQMNKWAQVYHRLGARAAHEYDGLAAFSTN
ncbi:hypothetical protein MIMGU_mgv1a014307mg [Erythranthe guttata]|uniref:Uncharacterized protein n=1 Tax=Erythranthe guttata TaxID=4155 RepID=A0A022R8X7_ERYGU|nr:hypothetical protein MIMGU_mgv1a014307mg [Erythranthe guttata]